MKFRQRESRPSYGEGVYYRRRFVEESKQPNGEIVNIDWPAQEIIVRFYSNTNGKRFDDEFESFNFDELEGRWSDRFNQWMPD